MRYEEVTRYIFLSQECFFFIIVFFTGNLLFFSQSISLKHQLGITELIFNVIFQWFRFCYCCNLWQWEFSSIVWDRNPVKILINKKEKFIFVKSSIFYLSEIVNNIRFLLLLQAILSSLCKSLTWFEHLIISVISLFQCIYYQTILLEVVIINQLMVWTWR